MTAVIADFPRLPDLQLTSDKRGLPPSHDALLLARFAPLEAGMTVLDLGTGHGAPALFLAARERCQVFGLDIQPELLGIAAKNASRNQQRLQGNIHWITGDIRKPPFQPGHAHLVTLNPPFQKKGTGRLPPETARAKARHELCGTLEDWLRCGAAMLRSDGHLCLVHRPSRHEDIQQLSEKTGLTIQWTKEVAPGPGSPARWLCVQARPRNSRSFCTASL